MTDIERELPNGTPRRFVVLANPVSANARRIGRQVRELERANILPIITVRTDRDPDLTRNRLREVLRGGDWLGVGAGDGTVNLAADMADGVPIAPLAGGNANDIAHMLHTQQALRNPRHILEHGKVVPVHPLYCHITPPDSEPTTRLAAGYISLGASGRAAHEINQSRNHLARRLPGFRKFHIGMQVCKGLVQAPEFKLQGGAGTSTQYERVFANGDRMAEHLRWQAAITAPEAQEVSIENKRFLPVATIIGRSLVGRLEGAPLYIGEARGFTVESETYLQADGEAMFLAAGTSIEIGISPQPFTAVTTKPAA